MLKYVKEQANKAKAYVSNQLNLNPQGRLTLENGQQEQQQAAQPRFSSSTMYKAAALMATIGAGAGAMLIRNARLNATKPAISNGAIPVVAPVVTPVAIPVAKNDEPKTSAISQSGSFNVRKVKNRLKRG